METVKRNEISKSKQVVLNSFTENNQLCLPLFNIDIAYNICTGDCDYTLFITCFAP